MYRQFAILLLAMVCWNFIASPVVSWLAWHKTEQEITTLEVKAQQDEKISALTLCSSLRQLELEGAAREKAITAFGGVAFGFLAYAGFIFWQRRTIVKK